MAGHPVIDSYDSDDGLYEEQPPGQKGNVGSNGDIELKGNCTLAGDATPGPDGSVSITSGLVTILGSTEPARERVHLPPIDMSFLDAADMAAAKPLKKAGILTYTLTDGIYYFSTIDFSALANLVINGDVIISCQSAMFTAMATITVNPGSSLTIYCTGDFIVSGGGIINNGPSGAGGKPEAFRLYSTGANIQLAGKSNFYGAVYAPNAAIDMGGTHDYYGAVIGRYVDSVGTGKVHYDEALTDIIRTSTTILWHEVY